jgi:REP element-mobilizing transposase RayT
LKSFDYSQPSRYFLTICAQDNKPVFGKVIEGKVALNALGKIAEECWMEIPVHFPNVELATHVVMPSHVHGVVVIRKDVPAQQPREDEGTVAKHLRRAQNAVPLRPLGRGAREHTRSFGGLVSGSIPAIVRSFKAAAAKRIRQAMWKPGFSVWQRGYYEHVICDEGDFRNVCEYIRTNPARHTFKHNHP